MEIMANQRRRGTFPHLQDIGNKTTTYFQKVVGELLAVATRGLYIYIYICYVLMFSDFSFFFFFGKHEVLQMNTLLMANLSY